MEKATKHFIKESLNVGRMFLEEKVKEVESRNPADIAFEKETVCFSFFDQDFIIDGEKIYKGDPYNKSGLISYGKKISKEETIEYLLKKGESEETIQIIKNRDNEYFCLNPNGIITLFYGEVGLDEYSAQFEEESKKTR